MIDQNTASIRNALNSLNTSNYVNKITLTNNHSLDALIALKDKMESDGIDKFIEHNPNFVDAFLVTIEKLSSINNSLIDDNFRISLMSQKIEVAVEKIEKNNKTC